LLQRGGAAVAPGLEQSRHLAWRLGAHLTSRCRFRDGFRLIQWRQSHARPSQLVARPRAIPDCTGAYPYRSAATSKSASKKLDSARRSRARRSSSNGTPSPHRPESRWSGVAPRAPALWTIRACRLEIWTCSKRML
jgi:hypothetical protein